MPRLMPSRALLRALLALTLLAFAAPTAQADHGGAVSDLEVEQSESVDPVVAGSNGGSGNLTYVLTLTNNGPAPTLTSRVVVRRNLPPGVTVKSVTTSTGQYSGVTWSLGALSPTQSATMTVVLNVPSSVADGALVRQEAEAAHTNTFVADHDLTNNKSVVTTEVKRPATAAISPTSHGFGVVRTGTSSEPQDFTITNGGGLDLDLGDLALSGDDAGSFEIVDDACSGETLAGGESCVVKAAFAPDSVGARSATLAVPTNAGAVSAALSGTGAVPSLTIAPTAWDFGSQRTGTTSGVQEFTVTNDGLVDAQLGDALTSGADSGDFEIVSNACTGELPPGTACQITVQFAPDARGAKQATLEVPSDAEGSPDSAALSGTGIAPVAAVAPAAHDFGSVRSGSESDTQAFTVANEGDAPLAVSAVGLSGDHAGEFAIVDDGCAGETVAAGESCEVTARFAPASTGDKTAALGIESDGHGSSSSLAVPLGGKGIAPAVDLAPASHAFGVARVGTETAAQTFAIGNDGDAPLVVSGVTLAGGDAGEFEIVDDACSGATVAAGESCEVGVRFAPASTGEKSAALEVASDAGGSPHQAALSGTGGEPQAALTPSSHDFGEVITRRQSGGRSFLLSNDGPVSMAVASATLGGGDAGDFAILTDGCSGQTVAAGGSCEVVVEFAPGSDGAKAAQLEIASDAPGSPSVATLAGTAVAPQPELEVDPASADFGSTQVGSASASRTFTVTNVGEAAADVSGAALGGTEAGDFEVVADECNDVELAPAEACEVELRFVPQAAGARSAELALDSAAPQTGSALSGTGTQPAGDGGGTGNGGGGGDNGGGTGGGGTGGGGTGGGGTTPVDPQPPTGDGGQGAVPPRATVTVLRGARLRTTRRRGRRVTTLDTGIQVSCPTQAADACTGSVRLTPGREARASRTIGRVEFTAAPGQSRVLRITLSPRTLRALRSREGLGVVVRAYARDGQGARRRADGRYVATLRGARLRLAQAR